MKEKDAAKLMPFGKMNYRYLIMAVVVVAIGLFIMTLDQQEFGFGFLGITLGPVMLMTGFILGYVALLTKPKRVIAEESQPIPSKQMAPETTAQTATPAPRKKAKKKNKKR